MGNPESAWYDAEKYVFGRIVTATKTKEGASAFRTDVLPPSVYECWRLNTGGGSRGPTLHNCYGSIQMGGTIEGRYKTREKAQEFAGAVMVLMRDTNNFKQPKGTNIQWFRLSEGGLPTVEQDTFIHNGKTLLCFVVRIGVELVFNLSTTY